MRNTLAVVGATALVLALALGHPEVAVLVLAGYVVWMWVRIPLERRDRLRQVDPTWHRGRTYDHHGRPNERDDDDQE
jgi:hypothetical protein